jgi:hypothetical protein
MDNDKYESMDKIVSNSTIKDVQIFNNKINWRILNSSFMIRNLGFLIIGKHSFKPS